MRYRILALMTGAQAGASIVQQGIGSLAPFIVAAFALSKVELGLFFMAMQLGSMLFTAPSGVIVDRYGERRVVLVSGSVMAAALLLAAALPLFPWFVFWMAVFGMGYAATTPAGGRAVLGWFERDRGFAMGVRQTGVPGGGLIGAIALPFIAAFGGYRAAIAIAAFVTLGISIAASRLYRDPPGFDDDGVRQTWHDVVRGSLEIVRDPRAVLVTLTCMILVSTQYAMNAFLTVTGTSEAHLSVHAAALAFALAQVCAVAGRLVWGWVSDHVFAGDRVAPLIAICALAGCALAALANIGAHGPLLLYAAAALLGLTGAGWNGLMAAALVEIGGARRAGTALGIPLTGVFFAGAAAPAIFGAIADGRSLSAAWAVLSAAAFAGVLPGVLARSAMRRAVSQEAT